LSTGTPPGDPLWITALSYPQRLRFGGYETPFATALWITLLSLRGTPAGVKSTRSAAIYARGFATTEAPYSTASLPRCLPSKLLLSVPTVAANLAHIFLPPSSNDATKRAHT